MLRDLPNKEITDARCLVIALLAALIVSLFSISNQSFWIDEGVTAYHVSESTLAGVFHSLIEERSSNLQMPFYFAYLWGWDRLFGTSEVALRSANIPFILMTILALAYLFKEDRTGFFLSVAFLLSNAMLWAYMDECRTYILFLAASSCAIATALLAFDQDQTEEGKNSNTRWLLLSLLFLSGCSLIALPWCLMVFLVWCGAVGFGAVGRLLRVWPVVLLALMGLVAVMVYYLWTIHHGAGAHRAETTLQSALFCIYETLGFTGMGPGRMELRESPIASLLEYKLTLSLPLMSILAIIGISVSSWKDLPMVRRRQVYGLCLIAGTWFIIQALGYVQHVRILGRHLIPSLLIWCALAAILLTPWWKNGGARRIIIIILLSVFLLSAIFYRISPRQRKDDYRTASAWAIEASRHGGRVLWIAEPLAGEFYGIKPSMSGDEGIFIYSDHMPCGLDGFRSIVFSTKPDLFDPHGVIIHELEALHFKKVGEARAFTFWVRQ